MMKFLIVIFFSIFDFSLAQNDTIIKLQWTEFKKNHTKFYRSLYDETERYEIFKKNLEIIKAHNARFEQGLETYELGITPFTDLTTEEFQQFLSFQPIKKNLVKEPPVNLFKAPGHNITIPNAVDWRRIGGVTRIKNQGSCGACWAFSVIGALEGAYFRKYGELIPFSEQQLIDCAVNGVLSGCDGGELSPAFEYMKKYGLQPEYTYPFRMYTGRCRANYSLMSTKIRGYVEIESGNEHALTAAVALAGPVAVAINADQIQFYRRGVFETRRCSHNLNHAVLVVGYGSTPTRDYWIIKNSWGRYFGQNGYMFMRRGINQCGIAIEPTFPVL